MTTIYLQLLFFFLFVFSIKLNTPINYSLNEKELIQSVCIYVSVHPNCKTINQESLGLSNNFHFKRPEIFYKAPNKNFIHPRSTRLILPFIAHCVLDVLKSHAKTTSSLNIHTDTSIEQFLINESEKFENSNFVLVVNNKQITPQMFKHYAKLNKISKKKDYKIGYNF